MKRWLSVKSAATYADISVRTMRDWLKEGLKFSRLPTGTIRIKQSDVDKYLESYAVNENAVDAMVNAICDNIA
jgi:excisionase family DNA binding protein